VGDQLRAAVDRSERLIDGLLLLARSERRPEEWRAVDLAAAAVDAIDAVRAEAGADGVRVDHQLGEAVARGDPALLERAVSNLVENAVRHNWRGGWVLVTTSTEQGRARVTVSNTGPDVGDGEVEALFEPFRRADRDRTGSQRGAGLGLSIVRAVAEAHGGEVRARPRSGGGLEVELRLPGGAPFGDVARGDRS
jgi:signal transduction histidine kinase